MDEDSVYNYENVVHPDLTPNDINVEPNGRISSTSPIYIQLANKKSPGYA